MQSFSEEQHLKQWYALVDNRSSKLLKSKYPVLSRTVAVKAWNIHTESIIRWKQQGAKVPMSLEERFYVYALLDTRKPGKFTYAVLGRDFTFDYEPFYIGKGQGGRMFEHVAAASKGKSRDRKSTKIRKILREGFQVLEVKIREHLFESEALALEQVLIESLGCTWEGGLLTNLAKGGTSATGYRHTKSHKLFLSILFSGESLTPGWKISKGKKGMKFTIEHKQALSDARKSSKLARKTSRENIKKAHAASADPEVMKRSLEKHRATVANWSKEKIEQHSRKLSLAQKKSWSRNNIEARRQQASVALKTARQDPEVEKRRLEAVRKVNAIQLTCPHCKKTGQNQAMKRWHFDNCKFK